MAGAELALGAASRPPATVDAELPPDAPPHRLHRLLSGVRSERLSALVEACGQLTAPEAVALTAAWRDPEAGAGEVPGSLFDRCLVDTAGRITGTGRTLRDEIERVTERGCEPMWAAVSELDVWVASLAGLPTD